MMTSDDDDSFTSEHYPTEIFWGRRGGIPEDAKATLPKLPNKRGHNQTKSQFLQNIKQLINHQ